MIGRFFGLILAIAAMVPVIAITPAAAQDHARLYALHPVDREHPSPRPLAFSASDAPAWLAPALKRMVSDSLYRLSVYQAMLFRRSGKPSFLAVVWNDYYLTDPDVASPEILDLFKVTMTSQSMPHLERVRRYDNLWSVEIMEPSGQDVDHDGIAKLFVYTNGGGSLYDQRQLVVLRLGDKAGDVTPHDGVQSIGFADLTGKGDYRLIASDDRWAEMIGHCSQCGPFFHIIFRWRNGQYEPDCRANAAFYQDEIRSVEARYAKVLATNPSHYDRLTEELSAVVLPSFDLILMGKTHEGRERLVNGLAKLREELQSGKLVVRGEIATNVLDVDEARDTFVPVANAAVAHSSLACPLLGYRQ